MSSSRSGPTFSIVGGRLEAVGLFLGSWGLDAVELFAGSSTGFVVFGMVGNSISGGDSTVGIIVGFAGEVGTFEEAVGFSIVCLFMSRIGRS